LELPDRFLAAAARRPKVARDGAWQGHTEFAFDLPGPDPTEPVLRPGARLTQGAPVRSLGPGSQPVESSVVAVITRFRFKHVWDLVGAYLAYRRITADARLVPGYLHSAFLVQGHHSCCTLSLWADAGAIARFGTLVPTHARLGNWAFPRLRRTSSGPELWSTRWQLAGVSNNVRWEGFDLHGSSPALQGSPDLGTE
jgi:hypothetical protein